MSIATHRMTFCRQPIFLAVHPKGCTEYMVPKEPFEDLPTPHSSSREMLQDTLSMNVYAMRSDED